MGSLSVVHWAAVLLVVVLVFGTKKLGNIGADLGKAVRGFKDGVKGEATHADVEDVAAAHAAGNVPDNAPIHIIGFNEASAQEASVHEVQSRTGRA